jgi:sulfite exporter TauE/SafE
MSSTDTLLVVFLATGFTVGFGHCIGMCGPLVVSMALSLRKRSIILPHLLYSAGRVTTYTVLGAVMGLTGSFTGVTAPLEGLQQFVLIFAGLLIIAMGLAMTGWLPLGKIFADGRSPGGILSRGYQKLTTAGSTLRYYPLGILLGLLPCGPVYTALIASARAGMEAESAFPGAVKGASLMLAFGLGTVPALFLVARLSDLRWLKSRAVVYRWGAFLMMGVGVYYVIRGVRY